MITKIKNNLKSGLTVAMVSIPLAISLGVASNVTPLQGIITAIWAGLIASFFAGSNYNIIGPTGALSGVIASYALINGPQSVPLLAIMTGLFILIAYFLRFEKYLVFIPSSVIHGFTLGVAFIICLGQINAALGLKGLPKHPEFIENVWESLIHLPYFSSYALGIFLTFFFALNISRRLWPTVPSTLLLSPFGILIGYCAQTGVLPLQLQTLGSQFGTIKPALFQFPSLILSDFSTFWAKNCIEGQLITSSFVIALIAILETLLSAKIADSMTKTKHNSRKEFFGLGIANIVSGLAGGIPATAALARTSLNIKTGATDKISATISGLCIGVGAFLFVRYFSYMPMAVIAAILVNVSINMVERQHFDRLYKHDIGNFCISMVVALIIVYKDPIVGILAGASLSLLFFVEKLSHGHYELTDDYGQDIAESIPMNQTVKDKQSVGTLIYSFKGKLAYINSAAHVVRFESILKPYKTIVLRFREVSYIDIDGVDALDEIVEIARDRGQKVVFTNLNPQVHEFVRSTSHHFQEIEKKGLVFNKTKEALAFLDNKPTT